MERRTALPDARTTPRFAGICTFCRYPLLDRVAPASRPVDWAIYGVPHDGGVSYRPGTRFGPRAVREASQYVKPYSIEHDVDVCAELSLADGGDAPVSPYSSKQTLEGAVEFATLLGDTGHTRLFAVGGDHSIAYANMRATWQRLGSPEGGIALLHFDSHLDTVDTLWGEKWTHASPFIRAIQDGVIDPRRMLSVGIKCPLNTADDLRFARENGISVITCGQWRDEGTGPIVDFVRRLEGRPVYLSFDIDVVDPAFAPGTGTPSIGGLTSAEVLNVLRALAGANICGADVVEVLPDRDVAGITALLAAHVIFEILCLDAVRRRGGSSLDPA